MNTAELLNLEAAAKIPTNIRFGTSTWTYPGWKGLIYRRNYTSDKDFTATALEEYAKIPLFRTVGIDSTFYNPPKPKVLESYAAQVPENFLWVSKVWERISIPTYPKHPRYGKDAGKDNPDFLNADLLIDRVLDLYQRATIKTHTGPFVFQFPTISKEVLSRELFVEKLSEFLRKLPTNFRYATEIRNPEYLFAGYFSTLNSHGATHCFNHWNYMPTLKEQMIKAAEAGGLTADFFVSRILTPRGVSYENAVKLFQPYDRIKRENPEMRQDIVRLAKRAVERSADAFIIVNNRAEGNAPLTIDAISRMIVEGNAI